MRKTIAGAVSTVIAVCALAFAGQAMAQEKLTVWWVKGFYKSEDDALFEAMKKFELEPSAAENYVLQFQGTDLDDKRHIEVLGQKTLMLVLALKKEPVKG
jgi:multiple sugar transport system substrate-binding protein